METIIENGKRMKGIPYPVAIWDKKRNMWDDSIEELGAVYANSEDEAIDYAIEYVKDSIIMYGTEDEDEQSEQLAYYSDPNAYKVETEGKDLNLYVFEQRDYKGNEEILLYTDRKEAVEAARNEFEHMCDSDKRDYTRDARAERRGCGEFRVYAVSIPYEDLRYDFDEPYTEDPYTEYEDYEVWNALKED